ncbi:HlyD family secretion protein [Oryzomonas japonica]|uniref:HlyD family secretion protein n=1 Tax=Oryzomonas japonica TaxID=2603858 RepID=A0A7J4ZLQ0_9BACT|nr:HlyD family secretion protein [Oryzomonas japonica]KAB0663438.1 HlyD family secretion protein [Oryzomonas japonica]
MSGGTTTTSMRVYAILRRVRFGAARHPAVFAALFLALLACGFWLHNRLTHVEENDAKTAGEVITIASRLDGWLVTRPVIEGDHVRKGQVLGELDTRDAKLRLATLENNLAAHDAHIREITIQRDTTQKTTTAGIADARAQVTAAREAVAVIAPQADLARADFARSDALVGQGAVSRENWDHTRSTKFQNEASLRQARSQLTARQATLAQTVAQRGQVAMLGQQLEVLRRERAALASQVAQVRQEIADRTLRAPCDGIVDRTFIHAGDYVQAGQWLMMLHDPNDIWVEANVKETAVGKVRVGQPVNVAVDAYPNLGLHGRVIRVGNAATNQFALLPSPNPSGNFTKITQRVPVRIAIDKPKQPLQPGLMVEVSINVAH